MDKKPFNIEKDFAEGKAVAGAPLVGGEFITEDGDWQGQTVEVQSEKHLEDDHGTGEPVVIRTFEFTMNQVAFKDKPSLQQIFDSHKSGISAFLWQDGLTLMAEVPPQIIFAKDRPSYYIMVTAKPSLGQSVVDRTFTLSELIPKPNESKRHTHSVHRELQLPSTKKKKASRATKASK